MALALVETTPIPDIEPDFGNFWLLFPRKEARKDAQKAWAQMDPDHYVIAITALVGWRKVWAEREQRYIPLPASWLRGERYFDELPKAITQSTAAHAPFVAGAPTTPKGEIPDHVKAMIAKLKGPK